METKINDIFKVYSVLEIANMLGIGKTKTRELLDSNILPVTKVGRQYFTSPAAIQDAITSNIKVSDYAEKYLYRKSLSVEAGKYKQSRFDRIERTYNTHLRDTEAVKKTFSNLTADDIVATINAKKHVLSYSSLKKIFLFWSAMIHNAIELGELPKSYNIMNHVEMPDESVLTVETKEIQIIPPEHQRLIKEIAMEYSPNKNERYLYRYGPVIVKVNLVDALIV